MALRTRHPAVPVSEDGRRPMVSDSRWQDMERARSVLWYGFGGLWLLDGLLQLQHPMFTLQFVRGVLVPALSGQPAWLSRVMTRGIVLWEQAPQLWNAGAAGVQIWLGVLFLLQSRHLWGRIALGVAIAWSLFVWVFAEGLGGLLNGTANWFMGGPGSSLFYAVAAGALLLPIELWLDGHLRRWLHIAIAAAAALGVVYQSLPGLFTPNGVAGLFGPYGGSIGVWVRGMASDHAVIANAVMVTALMILAFGWYRGASGRAWYIFTASLLFFIWAFGQNFGVLGGLGTDPNTIPPLGALMLAASWAPAPRSGTHQAFPSSQPLARTALARHGSGRGR